jgi:hypothetical protein
MGSPPGNACGACPSRTDVSRHPRGPAPEARRPQGCRPTHTQRTGPPSTAPRLRRIGDRTTPTAPAARPTTPPSEPWATAGWRSCGTACARACSMTRPSMPPTATATSPSQPDQAEVDKGCLIAQGATLPLVQSWTTSTPRQADSGPHVTTHASYGISPAGSGRGPY